MNEMLNWSPPRFRAKFHDGNTARGSLNKARPRVILLIERRPSEVQGATKGREAGRYVFGHRR